jgi:hypothetical protein
MAGSSRAGSKKAQRIADPGRLPHRTRSAATRSIQGPARVTRLQPLLPPRTSSQNINESKVIAVRIGRVESEHETDPVVV